MAQFFSGKSKKVMYGRIVGILILIIILVAIVAATQSFIMTRSNEAQVAQISNVSVAFTGTPYSGKVSAYTVITVAASLPLDNSVTALNKATLNWGDGSAVETYTDLLNFVSGGSRIFDYSHKYTRPGTYTITYSIEDSNGGKKIITTSANITYPPITFSPSLIGKWCVIATTAWWYCNIDIRYQITNRTDKMVFISKDAAVAISTTTSKGPVASTTLRRVYTTGSYTADTADSYGIAPGTTREFKYDWKSDNTNGNALKRTITITRQYWGYGPGLGQNNKEFSVPPGALVTHP